MHRVTLGNSIRFLTVVIVAVLVCYPLVWLVIGSFQLGGPGGALSVRAYRQVLSAFDFGEIVWNTFWLGSGSVVLSLLFGVPLAWIVGRTNTPFKGFINLVALVPFITPPIVGAIAWSYLGGPNAGFLNVWWEMLTGSHKPLINIFTLGGLIWAMTLYVTPTVFLITSAALRTMDPALENAAVIAGASAFQTAARITLPLVTPALLGASVLAFVQSLEIFAIPAALGIPGNVYVFTTQIWRTMIGVPPRFDRAAAMAMILVVVSALVLFLQRRFLTGERQYTTVVGRTAKPRVIALGPWRYVTLAYAGLYLLMSAGLPYLVLVYGAVVKRRGLPLSWNNLTLANLTGVFAGSPLVGRSIGNSLLLSVTAATVGTALATVSAYIVVKTRSQWRGLLDLITFLPIAVPGTVIAVGMVWAYLRPPFSLYGTLWILGIAYVTRYLPLGARAVISALTQIHTDLERAAEISGARWLKMFRRILIPLILPSLGVGWILMFVSSMRELSSSIILYSSEHETIAVALFLLWDDGHFELVSVLSLILAAISMTSVLLVQRLLRGREAPIT